MSFGILPPPMFPVVSQTLPRFVALRIRVGEAVDSSGLRVAGVMRVAEKVFVDEVIADVVVPDVVLFSACDAGDENVVCSYSRPLVTQGMGI